VHGGVDSAGSESDRSEQHRYGAANTHVVVRSAVVW